MKIIVDAFGGDNAPEEILKGCRMAADELGVQILLTGDREKIEKAAGACSAGIRLTEQYCRHLGGTD